MKSKSLLTSKDAKAALKVIRRVRDGGMALTEELECLYKARKPSSGMEVYLEATPGQSYGPKMEKLYIKKHKFEKVSSKKDRGDFITPRGKYIEYKFTYSPGSKAGKFNFVQIRPWQKLAGYVFEDYCDTGGFITFHISKNKMSLLLEEFGMLAHGTKETNKNDKKEYALRGSIGDELWKKLLQYDDPKLVA